MEAVIIANPASGGGRGAKALQKLTKKMVLEGIPHQVHQSTQAKEIAKLCLEIGPSLSPEQRLIILGGDGSLNEAVTALSSIENRPPIAYLPAGTGNDFARERQITHDVGQFLQQIKYAHVEEIEHIRFKEEFFQIEGIALNSFGLGIDAKVNQLKQDMGPQNLSWFQSKKVYLSKIQEAFQEHQAFEGQVSIDGGQPIYFKNALFCGLFNHGFFGGGIHIVPQARSNSQQVHFVVAHDVTKKTLIKVLPNILFLGSHFKKYPQYLDQYVGSQIDLQVATPQVMQADGEVISLPYYHLKAWMESYPFWIPGPGPTK